MSTDINTNNNASQTLFRFATTRNAELSDPKNKERRFIFRKDSQKGVFDINLNSSTTLRKLCESPKDLPLTLETENSLKEKDSMFYDLAVWVARNKATATKTEFDAKIREYLDFLTEAKKKILPIDSNIWDNLVYQVTTLKDFYAKETLMQFIHLNHILTTYVNQDEETYNDVIKAKVVLPKELFKANDMASNSSNASKTETTLSATQNVAYNDAGMKFAEAKMRLQANQSLASKVEAMEKSYRKRYKKLYDEALNVYENKVAPLRKEYQNRLAEAEYQRKLLIDSGNNGELSKLAYIPAPELPEFDFDFGPEVQGDSLLSQFTEEQQLSLNNILEGSSIELDDISTFNELNQLISDNNQALQQIVLDNTVLNQQISTTVGGIVVPITSSASANGLIPYSVKTYNKNGNDWFIMLTIDNYAHNIISGSYKVTLNGTDISSSNVTAFANGISSLFQSGLSIPASQTTGINELVLSGEMILDDWKTYSLNVTLTRDESDFNMVLKQGAFKGSSVFRSNEQTGGQTGGETGGETGSGSETTTTSEVEVFIPSGFGMKNVGITDYKKVEQSTYCYVEGEVAHIENIMAREYKERSTRKLRRSENQITKSSESEKEKLSDTTSTDRHEMQSEISKILLESKDFAAQAGFGASWGGKSGTIPKFNLSTSANYATHNSKEESNRQAMTEAKDITSRALDRIVTKVKEERIDKIIEEFEENNRHGFDNTKGSNHVVGVYRWVDKIVKNQIYNYGKRMMFEFMIPEPAKLHKLGMKISNNAENQLIKPIDPRSKDAGTMQVKNFTNLNDEIILKYWLGQYKTDINNRPLETIYIGQSFSYKAAEPKGNPWELTAESVNVDIPSGYQTISACMITEDTGDRWDYYNPGWSDAQVLVGNKKVYSDYMSIDSFVEKVPVSYSQLGLLASSVNISIKCQLTQETKNAWLQETFNKIIEAYETELAKYEQALAEARALGVQIKGSNPGFYRKIENTILRRNCISYMVNQTPSAELTFGKKRYKINNNNVEETFTNTDILVDEKLDNYAAFVKFMEQAFEWEIMSYYLYPYYWGQREAWADLYQFDDNDPVFRAFMQSGMARVIVTVRPGFEEAVRHFLATGQIWNGGEVPVLDDPLFLSIVDEMRAPKATKEGEPWREKIPTALTILQADSIGLKVEKALPSNCEPGVKFDDNLGELCGSNFQLNQNQIGQSNDKWIEISFDHLDRYLKIGEMDDQHCFPRKYECLGNTIEIDRDATWDGLDSTFKLYKTLADELSQIEGLVAYPTGENGITFKVNVSKINNFTFTKPGDDNTVGGHDLLKFSVDLDNSYLKLVSPEYNRYGNERVLDKDGQVIPQEEYMNKVPLAKFLV